MADITKKKYVDSAALQHLLEKLRDKNKELFLGKMAEAASAAKVNHALTLTVGENDVVFDGSEVKSAAVAAKVHKHTHADITDFDAAVKKAAFGDEHATMTAHTHDNKAVLDTVSADRVGKWDAKISVDDVAKIKYENTGMTSVKDVKGALDVLVANVQIAAGQLTATSKNMDAVKKIADDAAKAAADEKKRAEGKEGELQTAIDTINNAETGILKQAKDYADGKDAAIAAAKAAADAAQADVDALEGVVGTAADTADKTTVFGKIAKAQAQADKGVADADAEATRAQGVEQGLRTDLGQATDAAKADGSAFARIAQVKADLTAEANRATGIEQGLRTDVDAAQNAIDVLNGGVDQEGSVDKKIADKISEVNTAAGNLEKRVKANEDAITVINGEGEGSIKKAVANLVNGAPEAMDTLNELAQAITTHQGVYEGYVAQVAKDIAAAKTAAITEAGKNADSKDEALHNTITTEIATAKSEAINDAAAKDTALENKLQANINKKVDQTAYDTKVAALEKADTDNLAAAKKYADDEDAKIEAMIGTKEDLATADTVYGKIKALQEKDASQDGVIATKAAAADLDTLEALVGTVDDAKTEATVFGKIAAEADRAKVAEEALAGRVTTAEGKITALETTVGKAAEGENAATGLVKDVADLKAINADVRLTAAETSIDNLEAWVAAHGTITNTEIDEMLNTVYGTQA